MARPLLRPLAAMIAAAFVFSCAQPGPPLEPPAPAPAPAPAAPAAKPPAAATRPAPTAGTERGKLSLYGRAHAGKPTASGEPFDPDKLTMAHRTLPFGTRVRVTNLENQRSVVVVVNDRGPFIDGRIADLSAAAARRIDMIEDGVVEGLLEILR